MAILAVLCFHLNYVVEEEISPAQQKCPQMFYCASNSQSNIRIA